MITGLSLKWQHQLCKNPKPNLDIKTLFVDHTCRQSQPNGACNLHHVSNPLMGSVLKPAGFPHLDAYGLYKYNELYSGLSFYKRGFGVMIDPLVTRDLQMQEWYNENKAELQELLNMKSYKNSDILLPYPKDEDIISIVVAVASLRTISGCAFVRVFFDVALQILIGEWLS
ncbi:CTLH LisH motif, WD40/YVTN repeat-like-containing domain, Topless family [Artemisia annua]|uniref:CTLH LisH motif, WD40/YVTN repeat-like-containing domain, Topless family n=1 Tax=Artemisia annua TaxID=35608 RepID=A0A2U1LSS5_ARTAN|nr:CTLH LisH motif, WD40/YVTN repeat-like-containing domain, Topless family [Artemisia annua]